MKDNALRIGEEQKGEMATFADIFLRNANRIDSAADRVDDLFQRLRGAAPDVPCDPSCGHPISDSIIGIMVTAERGQEEAFNRLNSLLDDLSTCI